MVNSMGYFDNLKADELEHHGILGQKWGVRRFQNKDGSLNAAGRKRYGVKVDGQDSKPNVKIPGTITDGYHKMKKPEGAISLKKSQSKNFKEISRSYKKNRDTSRPYMIDDKTKGFIKERLAKLVTDEDSNKLSDAKKKWLDLENKTKDFFDSKEYDEATKKAYDATLSYFKKNNPEYLKEIIAKNNGNTAWLDAFHDFRKVNEGYEDEYWSKAEKKWSKTEEAKQRKEADTAWDNYIKTRNEISDNYSKELLGKYSNKKLSALGNETYSNLISQYASTVIEEHSKNK